MGIGETGVGEMGVGETGTSRKNQPCVCVNEKVIIAT